VPSGDPTLVADHKKIEEALRKTFRPEFLNRIDEIIIFEPLSREDVEKIVDLQMQDIAKRLEEQGLYVTLTDEARRKLAEIGYDPQFGARPLRRALQRYVESPLSIRLLKGEFVQGDLVEICVNDEGAIDFRRLESGHTPPLRAAVREPESTAAE
jgi:ATP-dependent Clp protease ATP-binding subunit ClpC